MDEHRGKLCPPAFSNAVCGLKNSLKSRDTPDLRSNLFSDLSNVVEQPHIAFGIFCLTGRKVLVN